MKRVRKVIVNINIIALIGILLLSPGALAQTRIKAPNNPYSLDKDVQLGRQAADEVERKLPLLNDRQVDNYVARIGQRLVSAIPPEFDHQQFEYSFKVVNVKEINAFALPGGYTYVNRGLIDVANNEGELAGVMAHEISHVALRHGTAQAAKAQKYALGAAAGQILGAIIGGGIGGAVAQGSQLGIGAYFLKFSRAHERQADLLGAQIMANAGYDPRDLANMFRTIERSSGGRSGPEWLSSHPNPGNRYEAIQNEAEQLRVRNPVRESAEFNNIQARLRGMPRASSMSEISGDNQRSQRNDRRVSNRVESPSTRLRTYRSDIFQLGVPTNWRDLPGDNTITFAPDGAYGEVKGQFIFTHGVMVGVTRARSRGLRQATSEFLNSLTENNPNLRQQGSYQRSVIDGHDGLAVVFSNVSDVTGRPEVVSVYTTLLSNGDLFYIIPVAPENDFRAYRQSFQSVIRSIQLSD
ncbi:MAG: M48 family metallopeptidase [Acidobacteriota bacterium]